jgi:hypothetical protein
VVDGWPTDPRVLDNVASLVFYSRPAGDIVLSAEHRPPFDKLMAAGAGYVAIHWATDADPRHGEAYLAILGGWFHRATHSGLTIGISPLKQLDGGHPVCRGVREFPLHDEFYLNLKFHERARPILSVRVDGQDQTVAWAFERGQRGGPLVWDDARPLSREFRDRGFSPLHHQRHLMDRQAGSAGRRRAGFRGPG